MNVIRGIWYSVSILSVCLLTLEVSHYVGDPMLKNILSSPLPEHRLEITIIVFRLYLTYTDYEPKRV